MHAGFVITPQFAYCRFLFSVSTYVCKRICYTESIALPSYIQLNESLSITLHIFMYAFITKKLFILDKLTTDNNFHVNVKDCELFSHLTF